MNRAPRLPREDDGSMMVIAYGLFSASGLVIGLALGWWWWG